jgi:hypothetical protein
LGAVASPTSGPAVSEYRTPATALAGVNRSRALGCLDAMARSTADGIQAGYYTWIRTRRVPAGGMVSCSLVTLSSAICGRRRGSPSRPASPRTVDEQQRRPYRALPASWSLLRSLRFRGAVKRLDTP